MNDELRLALALVESARVGGGWSLQGFGMFRLYLGDDRVRRLHVWVPELAVPGVTDVHDHPWHFHSRLLLGELRDEVFDAQELNGYYVGLGFAPAPTHHRRTIVCGPGGGATKSDPEPVILKADPERTRSYRAGDSYVLLADELHRTVPQPGTITLVERRRLGDTEHANVLVPVSDRLVGVDELRSRYQAHIRAVFDKSNEGAGEQIREMNERGYDALRNMARSRCALDLPTCPMPEPGEWVSAEPRDATAEELDHMRAAVRARLAAETAR